ncbi:MAG TPA: GNAT family protein [Acidimicrobiales bacterium]|nr:GNAT family protein [Acidimicrobiales bacterium]
MTDPLTLEGRFVRLTPLGPEHVDALLAAANEDRAAYGLTWVPSDRPTMIDYLTKAVVAREAGRQLPLATWSTTAGKVVGSTRFSGLEPWDWWLCGEEGETRQRRGRPDVVEIGATWLAGSAQRTPVNTEAKLLMLTHAFETWEVHAVRFCTDRRNDRSRRAIERLGCTLDGILRADRPGPDGTIRDSAYFSLLAGEWPAAKRRLSDRLAAG